MISQQADRVATILVKAMLDEDGLLNLETGLQIMGLIVTGLFRMIPPEHRRKALDEWIDVLRTHFPHA